ncbi:MAG: hypothetical protein LUC50_03370 [Ruminococcus sp.]|nr:hypothetical protein [Ruminococcus sp.]
MQFASFTFLFLFLPITLGIYYLTPRRWRHGVMLGISVVFLLSGGLLSAVVLLLLTAGTYGAGLLLEHLHPRKKLSAFVITCVTLLEMGVLLLLRSDLVQGASLGWFSGSDLFPLGLSFYVLQSLSYYSEVHRGKCRAEHSVWKLSLYLLFYPRLIMGPVVSYRTAIESYTETSCSVTQIGAGLLRMLVGLAKKLVLADLIGTLYLTVTQENVTSYSILMLWIAALAKLLALYFELSGYADLAIGIAQCYGVKLPESYGKKLFYPTLLQLTDQWNRTVVQWFFHYVGTRFHGKRRSFHVFAVIVTWGCIGLWYDFRITTLLCGLAVGCCVGVEHLTGHHEHHWMIRYVITCLFLCMSTVLLAEHDLADAAAYLGGMFGAGQIAPTDADWQLIRSYLLIFLLAMYAASGNWRRIMQYVDQSKRCATLRLPLTVLAAVLLLVIDTAALVSAGGNVEMQLLL